MTNPRELSAPAAGSDQTVLHRAAHPTARVSRWHRGNAAVTSLVTEDRPALHGAARVHGVAGPLGPHCPSRHAPQGHSHLPSKAKGHGRRDYDLAVLKVRATPEPSSRGGSGRAPRGVSRPCMREDSAAPGTGRAPCSQRRGARPTALRLQTSVRPTQTAVPPGQTSVPSHPGPLVTARQRAGSQLKGRRPRSAPEEASRAPVPAPMTRDSCPRCQPATPVTRRRRQPPHTEGTQSRTAVPSALSPGGA